jgi:hypothetical protein
MRRGSLHGVSRLWLLPLVLQWSITIASCHITDQHRLYTRLLENYSELIRPVYTYEESLTVKATFNLITIIDFHEGKQILNAKGWLALRWVDRFLLWNESDYGGIAEIYVPQNQIWLPDVQVENSVNTYAQLGYDQLYAKVSSDGHVFWDPGHVGETTCRVDVSRYPFDTQTCPIELVIWMHPKSKVYLKSNSNDVGLVLYTDNQEWEIIKTGVEEEDSAIENLTRVKFTITMRRRIRYYVFNTMLPIILFSLLGCIVFILPADSGEKIGLSLTILLTFVIFIGYLGSTMPQTSERLSILGMYITGCMMLNVCQVVMTVVVLRCHLAPEHQRVPTWARRFVVCFGWLLARSDVTARTATSAITRDDDIDDVIPQTRPQQTHMEDHISVFDMETRGSACETNIELSTDAFNWKDLGCLLDKLCFITSFFLAIVFVFICFIMLLSE